MTSPLVTKPPLQILIVDDHELMRKALRDLIQSQPGWTTCGEAANETEALDCFENSAPNLLIVDLSLKNSQGLNVIRQVKAMRPEIRILVLSMHDENLYAERCLRAGAQGFINKQEPTLEILRAIKAVLAGEIYVSEKMAERLLHRILGGGRDSKNSPMEILSDRELEIFCLIGQGWTTESMAEHLKLSPNTIGTYRERLKRKLKVANAIELTRLAINWVAEFD